MLMLSTDYNIITNTYFRGARATRLRWLRRLWRRYHYRRLLWLFLSFGQGQLGHLFEDFSGGEKEKKKKNQ
jgi:hypothetical protein